MEKFREREWEEYVRHRYKLVDRLGSLNITQVEKERLIALVYSDEENCNLAEIIINHKYDTSKYSRYTN